MPKLLTREQIDRYHRDGYVFPDPAFVSLHQDSTYWGLDKPEAVSAWVALTPSTLENGAMQFIPGTHTADQMPHRDTFELEPRPSADMDPEFVALHRRIADRNARILYRGTNIKSYLREEKSS